jgi:hypothetical protein
MMICVQQPLCHAATKARGLRLIEALHGEPKQLHLATEMGAGVAGK